MNATSNGQKPTLQIYNRPSAQLVKQSNLSISFNRPNLGLILARHFESMSLVIATLWVEKTNAIDQFWVLDWLTLKELLFDQLTQHPSFLPGSRNFSENYLLQLLKRRLFFLYCWLKPGAVLTLDSSGHGSQLLRI